MGDFIAIIILDLNTRHTLIFAVYFSMQIICQKLQHVGIRKGFLKLPPLKPVIHAQKPYFSINVTYPRIRIDIPVRKTDRNFLAGE